MSNINKYDSFGGIRPLWIYEQNKKREHEEYVKRLSLIEECLSSALTDEVVIESNNSDTLDDLEAKFQFLKNHSGSSEDLELAKEILRMTD